MNISGQVQMSLVDGNLFSWLGAYDRSMNLDHPVHFTLPEIILDLFIFLVKNGFYIIEKLICHWDSIWTYVVKFGHE